MPSWPKPATGNARLAALARTIKPCNATQPVPRSAMLEGQGSVALVDDKGNGCGKGRWRLAGRAAVALGVTALAGCATLTESSEQYVMVVTVLDHQQVGGIGCVLANDAGRWFVTSPGRTQIKKSTKPLSVDCRKDDLWVHDEIGPRQNASRWGNILLTAGAGQFIDRQTGAGFDYPQVLTVVLQRGERGTQPARPAPLL
ncbi:hypothetical protein [Pseudoduganella armeniaca]|uniref:hypothetical protein n=1 Tax=Pseudoduganella armeniaca TaxID=2072590 RepID=UPI001E559577|nr:hypothetical protein [Pseudoduganella armeniaca]